MQIENNLTGRHYTPYKTNPKTGYFKDFMQTAEGLVLAEQSNAEDGFIGKFVDYQEFHREWMSQPNTDYYFGHSYDVSEDKKENTAKVMTCTAWGSNKVMLRSDALMSYASPQTGESVNIYRADNYSKENPVYIIMGLDADGNEFEKEIDASKVDPAHCSYNELMVLNVETGHTSNSDWFHASAMRHKAEMDSYFDEMDWVSRARTVIKDYQTAGSMKAYLYMSGWLQSIVDYVGKIDKAEAAETAMEADNGRTGSPAELAFHSVAPNAPDTVKAAWMEAAQETGTNGTGIMANGMMSHISQLTVMKLIKRAKGEGNWSDVLGGSVDSALAAVKQALYQLENPLSERSANAQANIAKEKEFYLSFIEKLEALQEAAGSDNSTENETGSDNTTEDKTEDTAENSDYAKVVWARIEELYEKIIHGDTEQTFAIGAQSFTLKEWEKLLATVDAATEESTVLTSESTMCTYPASSSDEGDIRYITWYTEEGIFCRRAGQTEGYEWAVPFEKKEQYEKVTNLINQFPEGYNFRFTAHENFWTDYLNGEVDEEAFLDFMEETNNGVPDYSIVKGDSVYFDRDKMEWAKYLNPPGARIYTAEEMFQIQEEFMAENLSKQPKLTATQRYQKRDPKYNGEAIFRFGNSNRLYTAEEIERLMYENI